MLGGCCTHASAPCRLHTSLKSSAPHKACCPVALVSWLTEAADRARKQHMAHGRWEQIPSQQLYRLSMSACLTSIAEMPDGWA